MLYALCGDDYTCELINNEYKLVVRLALSVRKQYNEVDSLLRKVVPANLIIDLSLLWNQYLILEPFTHEELEEYLHSELREEDLNPANYNKYLALTPLTYRELTAYDHKNLRKGNLTNG